MFTSLLAARCSLLAARRSPLAGDEATAVAAQDAAAAELPASLPRFATHLEMHRGLMLARSGDTVGGAVHARMALDAALRLSGRRALVAGLVRQRGRWRRGRRRVVTGTG